jgi:tetratricopeptide (TPR) repeat protein
MGTPAELSDAERMMARRVDAESAVAVTREVAGSDSGIHRSALHGLVLFLLSTGEVEAARELAEQTLAMHEEALGPGNEVTASSAYNLGLVEKRAGRLARARALFERALASYQAALDAEQAAEEVPAFSRLEYDVSANLGMLGAVLIKFGEYEEAGEHLARAVGIRERMVGADHPEVANIVHYLAYVLHAQGLNDRAEAAYRRSLRVREANLATIAGPLELLSACRPILIYATTPPLSRAHKLCAVNELRSAEFVHPTGQRPGRARPGPGSMRR